MNISQKLIGQILLEKNFCNQDDIEKALEIQKTYGEDIKIGRVLINMGAITEEQLLMALAHQFGIEYISSSDNFSVVDIGINPEILVANKVYIIDKTDRYIKVLTDNPLNIEIFSLIEHYTNLKVKVALTTENNLEQIALKLKDSITIDSKNDMVDIDEEVDKLKELASEAPVIKLVNSILSKAIDTQTTDIHFESLKNKMRVRLRIDGILTTINYIPNNLKLAVIARLKLLSGMNIAESRLAQDGRISIKIAGKAVDIRTSSLPTQYGESFVLRMLIEEHTKYDLDKLGFFKDHIDIIEKIISKPNGIFLTTGPTGSGKTTTLYSMLSKLNSETVKIVTVEDPIEYELGGINQVQVKPEIGRTFASALRNILRQDPDIIMVGEIRDLETAEMAIQASLTGHLVLSTLHTNSALASITRLIDMGVEWFLIKASIVGLMAQRLVRTVCSHCAEDTEISEDIKKAYNLDELAQKYGFTNISPKQGKGCKYCNYTGYRGRTVISEVVPFDATLQAMFDKDKNFKDMHKLGYRTMLEDGLLKALEGKTTIEEILRVI